jgi:DNA end-binding protein Ku
VLVLSTLSFADEVNDPAAIPEIAEATGVKVSERERAMARQLVDSLAEEFDPSRFRDTHREAILEMIDRKAEGREVVAGPAAQEPAAVIDLMAALEASVSAAKQARKRHPTAREVEAPAAGKTGSAAKRAPAQRKATAAKKTAPAAKKSAPRTRVKKSA